MRHTDFWERMEGWFGAGYARSWAADVSLAELGGRTVVDALGSGMDALDVWRAVWAHERMPARDR